MVQSGDIGHELGEEEAETQKTHAVFVQIAANSSFEML